MFMEGCCDDLDMVGAALGVVAAARLATCGCRFGDRYFGSSMALASTPTRRECIAQTTHRLPPAGRGTDIVLMISVPLIIALFRLLCDEQTSAHERMSE